LPEQKVEKVEQIKKEDKSRIVAFAGDIGIARGALGSDAAIEPQI
jgi:hypothetical protein